MLGSQNNIPDETNGMSNAVSYHKEAVRVQCFLCYVTVCQFLTKFVERQWILYFCHCITLIKIANTPLDRVAVLVINLTHCRCTDIRLEFWPKLDLAR